MQNQKGFTLVEMAIVLTIVALLIGGVLKGQELLENAQLTGTDMQIKAYESAANTFYSIYKDLPGDMPDADERIRGCPTQCGWNSFALGTSTGNGMIGSENWSIQKGSQDSFTTTGKQSSQWAETRLFWLEMFKAGLITGVTDSGFTASSGEIDESYPAARIGGGFFVGYLDGQGEPVGSNTTINPADTNMVGHVIGLTSTPRAGQGWMWTSSNFDALSPAQAMKMDLKVDDGAPHTGSVRAFGIQNSCYGASAPYKYNVNVKRKDCGLMFLLKTLNR